MSNLRLFLICFFCLVVLEPIQGNASPIGKILKDTSISGISYYSTAEDVDQIIASYNDKLSCDKRDQVFKSRHPGSTKPSKHIIEWQCKEPMSPENPMAITDELKVNMLNGQITKISFSGQNPSPHDPQDFKTHIIKLHEKFLGADNNAPGNGNLAFDYRDKATPGIKGDSLSLMAKGTYPCLEDAPITFILKMGLQEIPAQNVKRIGLSIEANGIITQCPFKK